MTFRISALVLLVLITAVTSACDGDSRSHPEDTSPDALRVQDVWTELSDDRGIGVDGSQDDGWETLLPDVESPADQSELNPQEDLAVEDFAANDSLSQTDEESLDMLDMEGEDVQEVTYPCPEEGELSPATFSGLVYVDGDATSDTDYDQLMHPPQDSPFPGITLHLLSADETIESLTCDSGLGYFDGLAEGTYLVHPDVPQGWTCTSSNCPRRFPQAVAAGHAKVVTFGDSIPVYGPTPYFPTRFATTASALADIENVNVAVPGAMTYDWLPGGNWYQNRLVPELPDADVVVISLGGNDLYNFVDIGGSISMDDALEMAAQFSGFVQEILARLETIVDAIREVAPTADIVYILYPNYATTDYWAGYAGDYLTLVDLALQGAINDIREELSARGDLLLMDMYLATDGMDLDLLLSDPLHLSEEGTIVWGRELFRLLGGFTVGTPLEGLHREWAMAPMPEEP